MDTNQQYYRTAPAAGYCHHAESTFEKFLCTGEGPVFIRRGRTILYAKSDLDDWLASLPRYRSTSEADADAEAV